MWNSLYVSVLVQFWAPVTIEGRSLLTTRNQPFALNEDDDQELCRYRMISEEYVKYYVDQQSSKEEKGTLGLVDSAFLNKFTSNNYYSSSCNCQDCRRASYCCVKQSLAVPVFEPSGQRCVGVIEVVIIDDDEEDDDDHGEPIDNFDLDFAINALQVCTSQPQIGIFNAFLPFVLTLSYGSIGFKYFCHSLLNINWMPSSSGKGSILNC